LPEIAAADGERDMTTEEIIALGNAAEEAADRFGRFPGVTTLAFRWAEKAGIFAYEVLATEACYGLIDLAQRYCDLAADAFALSSTDREVWNLTFSGGRRAKLLVPSYLSLHAVWRYVETYGMEPALRSKDRRGTLDDALGALLVILSGFACRAE